MTEPVDPLVIHPQGEKENSFARLVAPFELVPFRWLWANSVLGSMRLILVFLARGWLILELTNSPLIVGLVPATRGVTQIVFGAFSGVLLERFDRRKMLVLAEWVTTTTAMTVGVLFVIGRLSLGHLLLASAIEGLFMSIRWPAINTLVMDTAGPERVLGASSTVLFGFNAGNIIATAIGGLVIVRWDAGVALIVAAGFGLAATLSGLGIPGAFKSAGIADNRVIRPLIEGLQYIRGRPGLVWILFLSFLMSMLGWSHIAMLPVIARDVLGLNADGLGFLSTAGALGALVATAWVASLPKDIDKIRLALVLGLITSALLVLFAISRNYALSLLLRFLLNGTLFGLEAALTAIVLSITAKHMQGRVQGVYSLLFGFMWFGGVLLGQIAELYDAPTAIAVGGIAVGLATILVWPALTKVDVSDEASLPEAAI